MPKTPLFIPSTDEEEEEAAPATQGSPSEGTGAETRDEEAEQEDVGEANEEPPSASTHAARGGRCGRGAPQGGKAAAASRSKKTAAPATSKSRATAEVVVPAVSSLAQPCSLPLTLFCLQGGFVPESVRMLHDHNSQSSPKVRAQRAADVRSLFGVVSRLPPLYSPCLY